jgi:hypothetical protein
LDLDFLYSEIYGSKTKVKWMQYHAIPEHLVHQGINWKAVEIAMKREPQGKRRFITKFCAKQLAMGRALSRRHHQPHDCCPRCDAENEDTYHILKCPSTSAYSTWTEALDALDDWMAVEGTDSSLRDAIIQRLASWRCGDLARPVHGPSTLQMAIRAQDKLGWHNFLMGRISPLLSTYQDVHYKHLQSRKTGNSWTHKVASQLWLVLWKMWEHRNHVAKHSLTAQDKRDLRHLQDQVKQQFQKSKTTLDPPDRWLLSDRSAILNYKITDLRQWLSQVTTARQASACRAAKEANVLLAQQRLMVQWRATANPRTPTTALQLPRLL